MSIHMILVILSAVKNPTLWHMEKIKTKSTSGLNDNTETNKNLDPK